jgi:multiple sugar transport system substrate-binding protein
MLSVAAVAPVTVALGACGRSSGPAGDGAPPSSVRIPPGTTVTYLGNHNQAEAQVIQPQMLAFEQKAAGVKVEVTNLTSGYMEKLQAMLVAGTPPDMFRTGGTPWAQLANQGAMAEIGPLIKRDKYDLSDFIEAAVQQYFWKGRHLGLGSNVGYSLIYYNTRIFQEQGIPAPSDDWARPWTWEQFNDAMRRAAIRVPGAEPERYGFSELTAYHRLQVTNGARLTNDEETRTLYDTPEAIEVWEWLYDMIHGQQVAQNPLTHQTLPSATAFITGKAAMWIGSTADGFTRFVPQKDLSWDVVPTPRGPRLKSDKWIFGGGSAWWIAAGSRVKDATWELMKHMQSPEVGRNLALGGFAPIRYSVLNSPAWLRSDQPPKSKRPLVDGLRRLLPFPKLTNWDRFDRAIADEVQALWRGERSGREVAQRIRQATDVILAEHQQAIKSGK